MELYIQQPLFLILCLHINTFVFLISILSPLFKLFVSICIHTILWLQQIARVSPLLVLSTLLDNMYMRVGIEVNLIEEGKKCITIQSYPSQWVTVYNLRNQTEYSNYSNLLTKLPLYRNSFFPFFDQTLEQFDTT